MKPNNEVRRSARSVGIIIAHDAKAIDRMKMEFRGFVPCGLHGTRGAETVSAT